MSEPILAGVVVHWRAREALSELVAAWRAQTHAELVVVDNDCGPADVSLAAGPRVRTLQPGSNLGFAGGANLGIEATGAPWILLLNPDARPEPGAIAALEAATRRHSAAAAIAPRLIGDDGASQHRWQLRPLPRLDQLLRQAFFLPGPRGPAQEPPAGAAVEQPAAAALLVSRVAWQKAGRFDAAFHPAWFEDVDFARRLKALGEILVYAPEAVFRHGLGGTVKPLGYTAFLRAYDRNLARYVRKHHGRFAAALLRGLLPIGAVARAVALPLRKPRRAESRRAAARALSAVARDALRGFSEAP